MLDFIGIPAGARIVDFGSGKGLAAITLSRYFAGVTGVEMSPKLVEVARRKVRKLGLTNVRFGCADAVEYYDGLDQFSHVDMFHPFPASVMQEVMENVRRSLEGRPRPLVIIY